MRSSSPLGPLTDIKQNIELAHAFVAGFSFADFQSDRKTAYAVTRCLEIISEASRRLPAVLKERHPEIPWTDIAAAGSVYRHGYQSIRDDIIWRTVQVSLRALLVVVEEELRRLEGE
jgi:uncharacterized protein with HEPN domain